MTKKSKLHMYVYSPNKFITLQVQMLKYIIAYLSEIQSLHSGGVLETNRIPSYVRVDVTVTKD